MAVVELVAGRLSRSHRDRDTDLSSPPLSSLSLSDSSVFFIRASPPSPSLPPSSILSLLSSRLPVLPPPDDSLLHEKNG